MNPILKVKAKLLALPGVIEVAIRDEAIKHRKFISDLNREQLQRGEKGDGTDMPDYVDNSKQPAAPGKITLFEDGDFHGGIEPLFEDEGFDMVGLDEKTWFLVKKYGKILDLNEASKQRLRDKLRPGILQRIKEQL